MTEGLTATSTLMGKQIAVLATRLERNTVDALTDLHKAGATVSVIASDQIDSERDLFENRSALARLTAAGIVAKAVPAAVASGALATLGPSNAQELILVGAQAAQAECAAYVRAKSGAISITSDAEEVSRLQQQVFAAAASAAQTVRPFALSAMPRVSLVARPAETTRIEDCIFAVYDTETTGLSANQDDRLLSFSCHAVRIKPDGQIERIASLDLYVDPGTDALGRPYNIPAEARKVNGLTREQLLALGAKPLDEALPAIADFLRGLQQHGPVIMAGQNIGGFDHKFLNTMFARTDIDTGFATDQPRPVLDAPFIDTRVLAQRVLADNPPMVEREGRMRPAWSLDAFIAYFGLPPRGIHTSDEDVKLTVEVLARLIQKAATPLLADVLSPARVASDQPYKPAPRFRTRLDATDNGLAVTRDDFVGGIEDAVANGESPIVRELADLKTAQIRDALAVLASCGYVCDAAELERQRIVATTHDRET